MIVSASYKTDIPAFYGAWFRKRLRAGYCMMQNPYGGQLHRVGLGPGEADGFVFWTRNPGPFLPVLDEVRERGFPFVVQASMLGYPRALEDRVAAPRRVARHLHAIARRFGPQAVVWRYDPILFTSETPADFHLDNFARLADSVSGACDEVVVSFAQFYRKTRRRLESLERSGGPTALDPDDTDKRRLLESLAPLAAARGLRLSLCAQPRLLDLPGVAEARCIDPARLSRIAGRPLPDRPRPHRKTCACAESRDIGAYDSCPHGCVYCYAVNDPALARRRHRAHDPDGEYLFPPDRPVPPPRRPAQPDLFAP